MKIGVIGGSGIYNFGLAKSDISVNTDYGNVVVTIVELDKIEVAFVCRHGSGHKIPPHKINYRANIAALKKLGVTSILATNAVGGIHEDCEPGSFILPNQIIDYTWGREHTFFDSFSESISHIDFTDPFDRNLRVALEKALKVRDEKFVDSGVYGCVQGPRLETKAEVSKFKNDGCTVLGMTGMPEAALARELGIAYVSICFSVNWAAGLKGAVDIDDVFERVGTCSEKLKLILADAIGFLSDDR